MKLLLSLLFISVITEATRYKCKENLSCGCGHKNVEINTRIINGELAVPYSWSMIVSLRHDFFNDGNSLRHACGGTILTDSYILTSANCVENIEDLKVKNLTIAAGIHYRTDPHQVVRRVDEIIIHPNWTGSWVDHQDDVALLHLSEPLNLEWNSFITRSCLPLQSNITEKLIQYPPIGTDLAVVGWGRTDPYEDDSEVLRQIVAYSINYNDTLCTDLISNPEKQFCARTHEIKGGPCYGDFGGPVFQWIKDHWEQVGISSFTLDGCQESPAIAYTRLAYYRDWIEEYIKTNNTGEIPDTTTHDPIIITESPTITYSCDKFTTPCGCGRRNVQFSQLDDNTDHEATPYSWSMIVSIRLNGLNKHSCSGSILSNFYILTSASCIENSTSFGITISAGIHNYSEVESINRKVDRIYFHPGYQGISDNYANDIAILHVSRSLNIENDIFLSRICLPKKDGTSSDPTYYPSPGTRLAVIGWGKMNCQHKADQHLLQQIQVYAVNDQQKSCYIFDEHRAIQFCAGIEKGVPCVGDPGSPVLQWLDDHWEQVGIASHTIDCVQFRNLGIYTRIVEYNGWIQSIISDCSTISPSPPPPTATVIIESTTTVTKKAPVFYHCNKTSTCGCGSVPVILTPSRIVGGENALEYSWPMMASMRGIDINYHLCGGSILSSSYILTAAHCVQYLSELSANITFVVGMTNLSDQKQIRLNVDRVYVHPNYTGWQDGSRHDLALVHINPPLTFQNHPSITKTCIHRVDPPILNDQYIKTGTRLTVIGWGHLQENNVNGPQILQQVEVHAIANDDPICLNSINDVQTQFCAGLPEGGKDACQRDSGGPIFQWTGQYWEQVGVVSYGTGCAQPGNPGVYVRLSYYYDWINSILNNDNEHLEPGYSSNENVVKPNTTTTSRTDLDTNTTTTSRTDLDTNTTTTSRIDLDTNTTTTSRTDLDTNTTTTSRTDLDTNTTTTSRTDVDTTTTINKTIPSTKSDAYNHEKNTVIYAIAVLLTSVILV